MTADEKYTQMTQAPVEKLICKLAVPTICSMLITSLYNMADTFFVGQTQNPLRLLLPLRRKPLIYQGL